MKKKTIQAIESLRFPLLFILMMWTVHIVSTILGLSFTYFGILPREIVGLTGIITAPLIHGDWQHLISNTVPMAALSALIFLFYRRVAVKSFMLIYLLTGLAVWAFGRDVWHIGASGVVYGLLSFVFWNGIFRRSFKSIALSLAILIMYSGYFIGIVPGKPGISWESHLYGALVGILVSYLFKDAIERDEVPEPPMLDETLPNGYLLPRDVFDKTLAERQRERGQEQRQYWQRDITRW